MTVSRLRSTEAITNSADYWPNLSAAYSIGGGVWNTYQFTGNGQDSINGQNYRVHRLELASLDSQIAVSTTLSFSKAGYIDFILVAAGGSAGAQNTVGGGGGGAGGAIIKYDYYVSAASYPCTVGFAQTPTALPSFNGLNSVFGSEIAIGGGGGGYAGYGYLGQPGGSGGGDAWSSTVPNVVGGLGTAGQGNAGGGHVYNNGCGGGGWATAAPYNTYASGQGSNGGNGFGTRFDGTYRAFCAGGGGGGQSSIGGNGGTVDGVYVGGMGIGSTYTYTPTRPTSPGCGGGGGYGPVGGPGSGGMLLIRYKI